MGSKSNDKWLDRLKDSVENHSEPLPDNFWEELQKDIPVPVPLVKRQMPEFIIWALAAAVVLLCMVLYMPERDSAIVLGTADAETVEVEPAVPDTAGFPVNCAVEVIPCDAPASGRKMAGIGSGMLQGNELADVSGHVTARGEVDSGQTACHKENDEEDSKKKIEDAARKEKTAVDGRNREQERAEYLKELEYLDQNGGSGKSVNKLMLAFVAGSGRAVGVEQDNMSIVGGTSPDITNVAGTGTGGNGSLFIPTVPDRFASFINMGGQQVENVSWLGGTSPAVFNNSTTCYICSYNHKEPVKLGVSFAVELVPGFYAESGVSYQYLNSRMSAGGSTAIIQKLHYIGIPFRLGVNFFREKKVQIYLSGGYLVEKCVNGVLECPDRGDMVLKLPGVLNSVNFAAGIQLETGNHTALYLEPGMYRYLAIGEELGREHGFIIKSRYSENPTGFSLQGGLRFMF